MSFCGGFAHFAGVLVALRAPKVCRYRTCHSFDETFDCLFLTALVLPWRLKMGFILILGADAGGAGQVAGIQRAVDLADAVRAGASGRRGWGRGCWLGCIRCLSPGEGGTCQ